MPQKYIRIAAKIFPGLITVFLIILIFISVNFGIYQNYQAAPPDTKYFGATGFYFDYYQILSWMRDGANGQLLVSSRYIPSKEPGVLIYPFYTITGFIGSRLGVPMEVTYHILRNIFLLTWLVSLYILVKKTFAGKYLVKTVYIMILLSGGFPVISYIGGLLKLSPFIDFWNNFYALQKFNIPAHHQLANTLFISLLIILTDGLIVKKLRRYLILIFVSVILTLINPASMTYLLIVLTVVLALSAMTVRMGFGKKEELIKYAKQIFIIIISVLPVFLYNLKIFESGIPWKYYYLGEKAGRYMVDYRQYLGSLGPFFPVGILSLIFIKNSGWREKIFMVWLIMPILIFPFSGRGIPISMSRLFSLNLFIPGVCLTVYFLKNFKIQKRIIWIFKNLIIVFLTISTTVGVVYSVQDIYGSYKFHNYYNVFVPDNLSKAIKYINSHTRKDTTVIAGENVSNLLPAFTGNHVVLGRLDAYSDYSLMKNQVGEIYFRQIDDNALLKRLDSWNVQYIIFGIDQINYNEFVKKGNIGRIVKVFESGDITLAEVK